MIEGGTFGDFGVGIFKIEKESGVISDSEDLGAVQGIQLIVYRKSVCQSVSLQFRAEMCQFFDIRPGGREHALLVNLAVGEIGEVALPGHVREDIQTWIAAAVHIVAEIRNRDKPASLTVHGIYDVFGVSKRRGAFKDKTQPVQACGYHKWLDIGELSAEQTGFIIGIVSVFEAKKLGGIGGSDPPGQTAQLRFGDDPFLLRRIELRIFDEMNFETKLVTEIRTAYVWLGTDRIQISVFDAAPKRKRQILFLIEIDGKVMLGKRGKFLSEKGKINTFFCHVGLLSKLNG